MKKFYIKIILMNGYAEEGVVADNFSSCHNYYHFWNETDSNKGIKSDIAVYPIDKTIIYKIEDI